MRAHSHGFEVGAAKRCADTESWRRQPARLRRRVGSIVCALVAMVLAGCAASAAELRPDTTAEPVPLVVHNHSSQAICYVNLSPSGANSWGPDRLSNGEMIVPGGERGWRISPGDWDIRLWSCKQEPLFTRRKLRVEASGTRLDFP